MRVDQRLDHRLVGVALLAFVVDDAFAGEAWSGFGEGAVLVDGVGDRRIDAARFQCEFAVDPNVMWLTGLFFKFCFLGSKIGIVLILLFKF